MIVSEAVTKQPQINAAVSEIIRQLQPWVLDIHYDIDQDWSGQWAIFFRVLITDEGARDHLKDIATNVVWRTSEKLDLPNLGLFPHFEFRSESEQARLQKVG